MRTKGMLAALTADDVHGDMLFDRNEVKRNQFARSRKAKCPRRRAAHTASTAVLLGIAARRNRRWAW